MLTLKVAWLCVHIYTVVHRLHSPYLLCLFQLWQLPNRRFCPCEASVKTDQRAEILAGPVSGSVDAVPRLYGEGQPSAPKARSCIAGEFHKVLRPVDKALIAD